MENYIKVPTAVRRFYGATTELVDIVPGLEPQRGVRGFFKRVIEGVRREREFWREGYGHYLQWVLIVPMHEEKRNAGGAVSND